MGTSKNSPMEYGVRTLSDKNELGVKTPFETLEKWYELKPEIKGKIFFSLTKSIIIASSN